MGSHQRSSLDADDLLLNGYFKTSRGRQQQPVPASTSRSTSQTISTLATSDIRRPSKSPRVPRNGWPPNPYVEDERDSLDKQFGEAHIAAQPLHDSPFRGVIDQTPILYESELSASDAAKFEKLETTSDQHGNGERRFVLIPRSDTRSQVADDDTGQSKKPAKDQPRESLKSERERPRHHRESLDSPPPITRRRSRQDLPTLTTKLEPERPSFRRSASAFTSTPKTDEPSRITRTPSANVFLSPDVAMAKGSSKDYFDFAAQSLPRKYGGSSPRSGTPINEVKPSLRGSSRPSTPNPEKASRASFDTQVRPKTVLPEKFTRPQQLAEENGARRPDRPSSCLDRHDSSDRYHSRQSSTQSSKNGYTSSDLDDSDSSDSDKRRRRQYRHHTRHGDSLHPEAEKGRHRRTSSNHSNSEFGKPQKRFSSPLPSPRAAGAGAFAAAGMAAGLMDNQRRETYPPPLGSKKPISRPVSPLPPYDDARESKTPSQAAPVRSRQSSPVGIDPRDPEPKASLPVPIPLNGRARDSRLSSSSQREADRSAGTSPAAKGYWQPPPFQPPTKPSHLDAPNMGSVRRFSQDIENGTIAPLPACPRTTPVCGKRDWLTLPKCPEFNICPTCYESAIEPTSFRSFFMPAPFRSLDDEVICDFGSQPWYRIAWLLLQKNREKDLSLIYKIAEISATTPHCLGGYEAVRKWHSMPDPETGQPIRNFDVCYACVKIIEALLPPIAGIFVVTNLEGPAGPKRTCDMRFDTNRFVHYFDALELTADQTPKSSGRYHPDTRAFVALAKRFSAIPPCKRDKEVLGARWYWIAQLPELTVCHECFDEVIRPEIEKRRAIAAMFGLAKREVPVGSCGMYSERMRGVFREAVRGDGYRLLARAARERREREGMYRRGLEDARRVKGGGAREEVVEGIEREWRRWE